MRSSAICIPNGEDAKKRAIPIPCVAIQSTTAQCADYGAAMNQPLRLHYAPDNASLCVRLALEVMGLSYEAVLVDRRVKAQKSRDYLALNPNGLIPVLETPDGPIYETAAILLWLADRVPGTVFPEVDAADRGRALTALFWLSNTLHPSLRMLFYPQSYFAANPDSLRIATQARIIAQLDLLQNEAWLDDSEIGILACYLAPMLRWMALYGGDTGWFDLKRWPRLYDFAQRVESVEVIGNAAQKEGLGPTPFSAPSLPVPPEGSAT